MAKGPKKICWSCKRKSIPQRKCCKSNVVMILCDECYNNLTKGYKTCS